MRSYEIIQEKSSALSTAIQALKGAGQVVGKGLSGLKTVAQYTQMAVRWGLPLAIAGNIGKEVYNFFSTPYQNESQRRKAELAMYVKISTYLVSAFAGMGIGGTIAFLTRLGIINSAAMGGIISLQTISASPVINWIAVVVSHAIYGAEKVGTAVDNIKLSVEEQKTAWNNLLGVFKLRRSQEK